MDSDKFIFINQKYSEPPKRKESSFIVSVFNFYFHTFFVPFQVKFNKLDDIYYLKEFKAQKILTFVCHLLTFCIITVWIIGSLFQIYENIGNNALEYFPDILHLFAFLSNLALNSINFWMFRCRKREILNFVEKTRLRLLFTSPGNLKRITFLVIGLVYIFNCCVAIITFYTGGLDQVISQYLSHYRLLNACIIVLIYIANVYAYLTYTFHQILFLFTAVSLRQLGKELEKDLESYEGLTDVRYGLHQYKILVESLEFIEIHWGGPLVAFCLCSISFYILLPYLLFSGDMSHGSKIELFDFLLTLLVWIYAAEFHYKVR